LKFGFDGFKLLRGERMMATKRVNKTKKSKSGPKSRSEKKAGIKEKTSAVKKRSVGKKPKAVKKKPEGKRLGEKRRRTKTRLNKKELKHFKELLLAERERILKELGRIEESIREASEDQEGYKKTYSNHLADLGTDYIEKEKNFYYANQEGHYLRSLEEALERIERGNYGRCEICGSMIPLRRLEAVPNARLCIDCKSQNELRARGR
jgi:DnaK suppressor protein